LYYSRLHSLLSFCFFPFSFFFFFLFFFTHPATPAIYTLSLHDALPIFGLPPGHDRGARLPRLGHRDRLGSGAHGSDGGLVPPSRDRKSTRLNSSHLGISYAVFCLKKKKKKKNIKQQKKKLHETRVFYSI